jgi:hypothetical protein
MSGEIEGEVEVESQEWEKQTPTEAVEREEGCSNAMIWRIWMGKEVWRTKKLMLMGEMLMSGGGAKREWEVERKASCKGRGKMSREPSH